MYHTFGRLNIFKQVEGWLRQRELFDNEKFYEQSTTLDILMFNMFLWGFIPVELKKEQLLMFPVLHG